MVKFRILAIAALLSGVLLMNAAPASAGECVELTARYEARDMGEKTVHDGCVGPSEFNNQNGHWGPTELGARWLVYVYLDVWYPLP